MSMTTPYADAWSCDNLEKTNRTTCQMGIVRGTANNLFSCYETMTKLCKIGEYVFHREICQKDVE